MSRKLLVVFFSFLIIGCVKYPYRVKTIRIDSKAKPTAKFAAPLKPYRVLSRFGKRKGSFHTGVDIKGRKGKGEKVRASRAGRVIHVGRKRGYGKIVVIKHGDGYWTRYAHLKKFLVKQGKKVKMGQPIGTVGSTGRSSGPHLHFEILTPAGRFVDPLRFIK